MTRKTKLLIGAAVALAVVGIGAGVGVATNVDEDTPIKGAARERATAAALAHLGGGEVTETEVSDEDGVYGVEIRLDDGREVEVALDRNFKVIGTEPEE